MDGEGYTDVDVIVDGALAQHETFPQTEEGEHALDMFVADVQQGAWTMRYVAEVYVLRHDHEMSEEEDFCAQYVTDGRPLFTFGPSEEGSEQ